MLNIGNLKIKYKAMLSPMASLTDIVFRKLVDEIGYAGLMVTEMISAEGIKRNNKKTLDMIKNFNFKTPQFIQIFGSESDQFVEAIKYIKNETNFSGIDINMGCPANKIVKRGAGAFLLKSPIKIAHIIKEIKKNTSLPITAKIRLGYSRVNVFEVTEILEHEGVDALTVHFRLKCDNYGQKARWEYAPLIKEKINTVLLGNGDIFTAIDAKEKFESVDGVMIGRGAISNPLIFSEIINKGPIYPSPGFVIKRLLELIEENYSPNFRLARIKAYARFLFSHRVNSKMYRQKVYTSRSFKEVKENLCDMIT